MRPPAELPAWIRVMSPENQAAWLAAEAYTQVTGRVHPGILAALKADPDLRAGFERVAAEVMAERAEAERISSTEQIPAWVRALPDELQAAYCAVDDHTLPTGEVHPELLAAVLANAASYERMLKLAALAEGQGPEGERCRASVAKMAEAKRLSLQ